jgi:hypothetical protein
MNEDIPRSTVHRYFAGLAENTFQSELGIVDPFLIDYLSAMLVRFVRSDVVHRIRGISGKPLMSVPEMVAEASARLGDARRDLHQHIGDFTLFWAGVYPEALSQPDVEEETSQQFLNYCRFGKQSYHIASTIETSTDEAVPNGVLHRLSDQFDLCCYGLREVRRQWENGGGDGGSILLN